MDFKALLEQANKNAKKANKKVAEADYEVQEKRRRQLELLATEHQREKWDLKRKLQEQKEQQKQQRMLPVADERVDDFRRTRESRDFADDRRGKNEFASERHNNHEKAPRQSSSALVSKSSSNNCRVDGHYAQNNTAERHGPSNANRIPKIAKPLQEQPENFGKTERNVMKENNALKKGKEPPPPARGQPNRDYGFVDPARLGSVRDQQSLSAATSKQNSCSSTKHSSQHQIKCVMKKPAASKEDFSKLMSMAEQNRDVFVEPPPLKKPKPVEEKKPLKPKEQDLGVSAYLDLSYKRLPKVQPPPRVKEKPIVVDKRNAEQQHSGLEIRGQHQNNSHKQSSSFSSRNDRHSTSLDSNANLSKTKDSQRREQNLPVKQVDPSKLAAYKQRMEEEKRRMLSQQQREREEVLRRREEAKKAAKKNTNIGDSSFSGTNTHQQRIPPSQNAASNAGSAGQNDLKRANNLHNNTKKVGGTLANSSSKTSVGKEALSKEELIRQRMIEYERKLREELEGEQAKKTKGGGADVVHERAPAQLSSSKRDEKPAQKFSSSFSEKQHSKSNSLAANVPSSSKDSREREKSSFPPSQQFRGGKFVGGGMSSSSHPNHNAPPRHNHKSASISSSSMKRPALPSHRPPRDRFINYSETEEDDDDDDEEEDEYDDEYDSEMADFIDDSNVEEFEREDFEEALRKINPRYNKKKWKMREAMIDERKMNARFRDIEEEERESTRRAIIEDMEEVRRGSRALK